MNDEQIITPAPADDEAAKPAGRARAPARSRKKAEAAPADGAAPAVEAPAKPARAKRAPRKPKAKPEAEAPVAEVIADLFAAEAVVEPVAAPVEASPVAAEPEAVAEAPVDVAVETTEPATDEAPVAEAEPDTAADEATPDADAESPTGPRRRRKRRRGKGERSASGPADESDAQAELPELALVDDTAPVEPIFADGEAVVDVAPEADVAPEPEPAEPLPLTVVSLGLEQPPVLSAAALDALRGARVILGTAEALDRLVGLALEVPQELCGADSIHLDLRRVGHVGSVLAVVGDGAGDGPGLELLAELGPGNVRLLAGVGRVQVACASLGLSGEIVSLVDLRRAPLAALRGQLRAHRLLAVPVADAAAPGAVARLLVDSGFAGARVWVCEFTADGLRSRAWLAAELAELREHFDAHAVLIVATGPSAGVFAELPGLTDAALGDDAPVALPLAARLLALAWLQPAAWEQGWAISDGEASLALEWARAVPTARVRAVGVEPSLLGVAMARAGVGENLAAIPSASPLRCREWPMPEAVFVRGGVGLSDWLAAAWARLAPGGRLVATAEDDHARADLLAFAGEVPAEAWQELSLSRGETVAGRLRFAPAAPIRLALWRKPLN
jgi:precorrin-6Y C5,15-methyltransferase (decarboxylating)